MGRGAQRRRRLPYFSGSRHRRVVHRRDRGLIAFSRSDDMTIADLLLPEFDQEMATTRRVLERVPEDKFSWKPHDKSFSMGDLASHVVNSVKWTDYTMNGTEFDLAGVTPDQLNQAAKSRAELLAWFDANVPSARA